MTETELINKMNTLGTMMKRYETIKAAFEESTRNLTEDIENLNNLLDWWTQDPYDHYNEWLSETYDTLKKAGKI